MAFFCSDALRNSKAPRFCVAGQNPPNNNTVTLFNFFALLFDPPNMSKICYRGFGESLTLETWTIVRFHKLLQAELLDSIHTVRRVSHEATQATRSCLSDQLRNILQQIVPPKLFNNHLAKHI